MIAQLISAAVIGALSPVAALAAIVLLGSRRPRLNTIAFLLGWTFILIALAAVVLVAFHGHEGTTGKSAKAAVGVVVGILLLGVALRSLLGEKHRWKSSSRPRANIPRSPPGLPGFATCTRSVPVNRSSWACSYSPSAPPTWRPIWRRCRRCSAPIWSSPRAS